ncbi:hypothetical protein MRX96_047123 [Rhipicephalus microplus]
MVSEASFQIEVLETVARRRSFDKTSGGTTLHDQSLAMTKHQERMATQFGTVRGGCLRTTIQVHDQRPAPWHSGTTVRQPLMDFLEHHCCHDRHFHSIRAAFRATIDFFLTTMGVAFPSVSQEHRARSHLGRADGCTRHHSRMPSATHERWECGALDAF